MPEWVKYTSYWHPSDWHHFNFPKIPLGLNVATTNALLGRSTNALDANSTDALDARSASSDFFRVTVDWTNANASSTSSDASSASGDAEDVANADQIGGACAYIPAAQTGSAAEDVADAGQTGGACAAQIGGASAEDVANAGLAEAAPKLDRNQASF